MPFSTFAILILIVIAAAAATAALAWWLDVPLVALGLAALAASLIPDLRRWR
jgi:hypothetical protein